MLLETETSVGVNRVHAWNNDLFATLNTASSAMNQMRQNLEELVDSIEVIADNATKLANVVADTSEAGRGFSVVATQIKKLAETSGEAADEFSQHLSSSMSFLKALRVQMELSMT